MKERIFEIKMDEKTDARLQFLVERAGEPDDCLYLSDLVEDVIKRRYDAEKAMEKADEAN